MVTKTTHRNTEKEQETYSQPPQDTPPGDELPDQSPDIQPGKGQENTAELPESITKYPVFRYNLDDSETPGGLKVRWKVRVITGPEAAKWEARQNAAIWELLRWAHQHRKT
ncbi:MAG TPA: hypothetical protein VGS19_03830 [Streptosporangiaceae bacterium]|nr:hypothetical protein [Streptosporangiaceae bacterium]